MTYSPEKNRAYLKARYDAQRAGFLEYLGGACVHCGTRENLEIDHIDPAHKAFTIARLYPVRLLPEVYEELEKCQALCNPCHIEKTRLQTEGVERGWQHGTVYGWMKKRCACVTCSAAKRSWADKRNAARRKKECWTTVIRE